MNRVTFLVDGFNVYHSAREARRDLNGAPTLWLDFRSLLRSFVSSAIGKDAVLSEIHYFSALATHMDPKRPGTTMRHKMYIECRRATGVHVHLGRFKYKTVWCRTCKTDNPHYEEKETDVALSAKLFELFHIDACDSVVLVTGDTDLAPAVRTAAQVFPTKSVRFAFPYKSKEQRARPANRQLLHNSKGTVCGASVTRPVRVAERAHDRKTAKLVKHLKVVVV